MITKNLRSDLCKDVKTATKWTEQKIHEVVELLEEGYFVHLESCLYGRVEARIIERLGLETVKDIYGDTIELVNRNETGMIYIHKKEEVQ